MLVILSDIMSNPGVILALLVVVVGIIALTAFLLKKYVINPKVKKEQENDAAEPAKTKEDIAQEELNRVLEEIEDENVAEKVKEYNEKED